MTETKVLGPDPALTSWLGALRRAPVTAAFLGACIVVFAVAESQGSTEDVATLLRFGATERGRIWAGEWWRLLTSAFLHIGLVHLVWNVIGMFGWCVPLERALGSARFAMLYLGGALAASGTSVVAQDVVSAGASGAGFAMVAATFVVDRLRLGSWAALWADPPTRKRVTNAVIWSIALAFMGVDNAAHAGGFVAGLLLAWVLLPRPEGAAPATAPVRLLAGAAVVVPVLLALVPRPGLTRMAAYELDVALGKAVERQAYDEAQALLERSDRAGHSGPWQEYQRAAVLEHAGDLEGAARALDLAAKADEPALREAARAGVKLILARRLLEGAGMASDPARARLLLEELCAGGEAIACDQLKQLAAPASRP